MGLRKGRQPIKGVSLTCSCGHPNSPGEECWEIEPSQPQGEGAGVSVPQLPSVIGGPVLRPRDADTVVQKEEGNVLRPRNRGKMGIRERLLQHSHLYIWDGSRVPASQG